MPVFYVAVFLLFIASFMPLLEILMTGESTIAQTPGMRSVFWFVTVVGGLAGVAHAIFGIFYPFGVTLDEAGIVCRTFLGRPWFVSWASLEEVELGRKGRVKAIKLYSADEGVSTIIPMTMGSDPIVIAETIEYFRRHPGDRELLNDPFAALSLVVDFDPAPQSADGRESRR
ncbi:hypothetical protein [Leucobacter coleopterorum]|nr:hypothetical protein [Leucobacter coleopterorum]